VNVRKSWPVLLGSIAVNFIGEPQAAHCGPWFCVSSMCCSPAVSPQFGALSSPATQPAAFDLKGSDAMTFISTWSHLGHSNNRCSKPIGPDETRSSIIRVWQREQRGRSIAVKNCWDGGTRLPLRWAGAQHSQSPVLPLRDGDRTIMLPKFPGAMVNIAHFQKYDRREVVSPPDAHMNWVDGSPFGLALNSSRFLLSDF
jgi:hypothetical protein